MSGTITVQKRTKLAEEIKEKESEIAECKAIPQESDSEDDKDVTVDDDNTTTSTGNADSSTDNDEDEPDTDWFQANKLETKSKKQKQKNGEYGHLDEAGRKYMQKVDALIRKYEVADDALAWRMVIPSVILFFAMILVFPLVAYCSSLFISIPWLFISAGLRVRLFIIFHDCGHGSYFSKFRDNMRVGSFLELCVGTPFRLWLKRHNRHHRVQGNSNKLDLSSTIPITVNEYKSLPTIQRLVFRAVREPIIFFIIAPLLVWDLFYLIWNGTKAMVLSRGAMMAWFALSLYLTAAEAYSVKSLIFYAFVWEQMFTWVPGLIGLTLFHLQHSANSGYRAPEDTFTAKDTALHGSTYVTIPWYLRWITLNIEFHHIHHWSTRVPLYKLEDCHNDGESQGLWNGITRIDTFSHFLQSLPNALWCDKRQRYVTFYEI